MIIKISNKGIYANKNSCIDLISYLQHEDIDRVKDGKEPEPFFSQDQDRVNVNELVSSIDNNRKQLKHSDAKFYVIVISPSTEELATMGATRETQAVALKDYIRGEVMPKYAEGFNKGLKADDLLYYGKIHYKRRGKNKENLYAHIIVARQTQEKRISISPMTTHTGKKNCGSVKGGFDRSGFYQACEEGFDKHFGYDREVKESYQYRNAMKNGTPEEMRKQAERLVRQQQERKRQERERNNPINKLIEAGKEAKEIEEFLRLQTNIEKEENITKIYTDKINNIMENSLSKYITLTEENIDKEHICCAFSDKKCTAGYELKKEWLTKEFANVYVFRRLDTRAKVFIEYVPAEYAWLPVTAPNYLMVNCFWVSGKYKGQGHGYNLLQSVIEDAKKQQKNGLVTVVGTKKNHFMSDTKWLLQHGFKCIPLLWSASLSTSQFI